MEPLTHSLSVSTCNSHLVSLDNDSLLSTETMVIFLERIFCLLGLHQTTLHPDDTDNQFSKKEQKELLHHKTDWKGKKVFEKSDYVLAKQMWYACCIWYSLRFLL